MSGSFQPLILGALLFVGGHRLLSSNGLRQWLVHRIGERAFSIAYSVIAAVALYLMIRGYNQAPYVELWAQAGWQRWVPMAVMPLVAILFVFGLTQYNPTMVMRPLEKGTADPAPGILKVTRHPMLWAFGLWGLVHIPPNGDLASVILFGAIAFLAIYGTTRVDWKRGNRDSAGFTRLAAVTSNIPLKALIEGRAKLRPGDISLWRLALAALVYVALAHGHPWFAGVKVM